MPFHSVISDMHSNSHLDYASKLFNPHDYQCWGLWRNDHLACSCPATNVEAMVMRVARSWTSYCTGPSDWHQHLEYGSTLNSYLTFVCLHNFPVEPTADTLSLYMVWMCHHIKPNSVDTYLSSICQLESYFPHVHQHRTGWLIHHTLEGCKCLQGMPTTRNGPSPLEISTLHVVIQLHSILCTYYGIFHNSINVP